MAVCSEPANHGAVLKGPMLPLCRGCVSAWAHVAGMKIRSVIRGGRELATARDLAEGLQRRDGQWSNTGDLGIGQSSGTEGGVVG